MVLFVSILMALLTFCFVSLIFLYARKFYSSDIFHRLRRHTSEEAVIEKDKGVIVKAYLFIQRISKPLSKFSLTQIPEKFLQRAGIPMLGSEFILLEIISGALTGVVVYMMTINKQFAIAGIFITPTVIWFLVLIRISKRRSAFTEQLSDCLTTVANALRAGYSFQQAMDIIAKEMEPPISEEFAHVTNDVSMGINLDDSLEQMARRVESSDFDLVVTAVLIQREIGGNLAQVLDQISDTINERIRMKREISALTAQGRLSAIVLVALPFITGLAMYFLNHDNFMILFEDPMGNMAVIAAIIMEVIGIFVIKRIVDIDV